MVIQFESIFPGKTNFIWSVADESLRDDFKRGEFPDIILHIHVLRRLDCVLAPTNEKVMEYYKNWKEKSKTKMVHYAVLQATAFTIPFTL